MQLGTGCRCNSTRDADASAHGRTTQQCRGCRHNGAQDADATVHGMPMQLRMGWRCKCVQEAEKCTALKSVLFSHVRVCTGEPVQPPKSKAHTPHTRRHTHTPTTMMWVPTQVLTQRRSMHFVAAPRQHQPQFCLGLFLPSTPLSWNVPLNDTYRREYSWGFSMTPANVNLWNVMQMQLRNPTSIASDKGKIACTLGSYSTKAIESRQTTEAVLP